jgi:predicted AAA+ superfamily ATPase
MLQFSFKKHLAVMIPCLTIVQKVTLANKMKTMREHLEYITNQHKNFNLLAVANTTELKVINERETFSNMDKHIIGRTEERDLILDFLCESMTKTITVLAIYGIGGLGKTTLAKMVYNSSRFKGYSLVWVYVSQIFDLKKIGNSIISQLSQKDSQYTELQMIHNVLSKLFNNKKILIVLDDLWEDNKFNLNKLKAMLEVGKGSRVVVMVTTRDESIANEISSIQPHKLALLTNAICWSIIKHKSDFNSRHDKQELNQIGEDIASKCGGVALAAQSLGYVPQSMTSRQWKLMRDNDIWSLSDSEDPSFRHALASLRLSYSVMPPYLKLCFAYCAIFPKGHKIIKDDLIQQWLSLDFIKPTDVYSSCELGNMYIRQLLGLSFLQNSESPLVSSYGAHTIKQL